MATATVNRAPCRAPGCGVVPRSQGETYCSKHRHLQHGGDATPRSAEHASRAAVLRERSAAAEADAQAWASGASSPAARYAMDRLNAIESSVPTTPEGAAEAWDAVRQLNSSLGQAEREIIGNIADTHGAGTYTSSTGEEWKIEARADRTVWDSETLLDDVDSSVPVDASNSEYVKALRDATSVTLRPQQIRSLMGGDLEKAYGSVEYGPPGVRPLTAQMDPDLYEEDSGTRSGSETDHGLVPDKLAPSTHQVDALAGVNQAKEITRAAVEKWTGRATMKTNPGDVLHDTMGNPVGRVTSGLEVRSPNHDAINSALSSLPDRRTIRDEYTRIANVKGKATGLKKMGLDPGSYSQKFSNGHRAKKISTD